MKEYKELLKSILRDGERHKDRTGVGTLSLFGEQLKIDMREGFPLVTLKQTPFRWIAEELMWMLSGSTDANELSARGVKTWDLWATEEKCAEKGRRQGDLGPTYGFLLRNFGGHYVPTNERRLIEKLKPTAINGHDQLWTLCVSMDTDPYSRRLFVSQWDPISEWELTVPPCQPGWQVKIHDDHYMSLRVDVRSQDAFVGLPFDIAHYGLLLHMLAWVTCRKPRTLTLQFGDLHIYNNALPAVAEMLTREPRKRPELIIDKTMWHATAPSAPGQDSFINLLQFKFDNLILRDYQPHPKISVEVAV